MCGKVKKMNERRSRFEIMANILGVAVYGAKKTNIMYKANLSFTQLNEYLKILVNANLLEKNGSIYSTTQKGKFFYEKCEELIGMLQDDPPEPPYVNDSSNKFSFLKSPSKRFK